MSEADAVMEEAVDPRGAIERQCAEIENQISHLLRSNAEMKAILETDGPDPDLREAIGENIVAVAKRKAILADLRKSCPELTPPAEGVSL